MNRREFFKMIFGAGAACVLPGVIEVEPEVAGEDSQKLTWATEEIAIKTLTDKQLEWLRKKFAESDCVGKVRIVPKCNSRVNWKYIDPSLMVDRSSGVLLNRDGTVAGLIHNIGN